MTAVDPKPTTTDPRRKTWTREEYHRLGEQGWFDGQRAQLIEGDIVEMSPQRSRHAAAISAVQWVLAAKWREGIHVRTQLPLALGDRSEPEPDLAIVAGSPHDYRAAHPVTALLVVEVSDTTLAFDRRQKQSLYAKAGLPEYWIVNLVDDQLEVYREPVSVGSMPFGFGYADRRVHGRGERVAPPGAPEGVLLSVDEILGEP